MEEEKKGFIKWVKAHKKELIIAGLSSAAIIGIIIGIRNKNSIILLWKSLQNRIGEDPVKASTSSCAVVEKITQESLPIVESVSATGNRQFPTNCITQDSYKVSDHIRNLPDGWNALDKKITTAAEYGYNLKPGQTWVETYTKGVCVA